MDETFSAAMQQIYWEKKLMDRYLTDPSSVWRINIAEGGVHDANVPDWYYQEYMKAQNNAHKEVAWTNVPGTSFQIGRAENGNVSMRGPGAFGGYQFSPTEWAAFLRVAISLPMGVEMPSTQGYGGTSHSNVTPQVKDDRPAIQARMEQNLQAMERWAIESSKRFPNSK